MGQLSFYSADALPRALGDLEGLLCGPGRTEVFGRGGAARLTIVLGPPPTEEADGDDDAEDDDAEDDDAGDDGTDDETQAAPIPDETPVPPDPEELAFLDLDPEELAARLAPAGPVARDVPTDPTPAPRPPAPALSWRARALRCALRARGVPASVGCAPDGRPQVCTAFRADLAALARSWTREGIKAVPDGFELDGPRLRLWVLAAGESAGRAYRLGLDPAAGHLHDALLTASRRAGLGAALTGDAAAPALRIVGSRRQGRLAELVGRPPRDLLDGIWPGRPGV